MVHFMGPSTEKVSHSTKSFSAHEGGVQDLSFFGNDVRKTDVFKCFHQEKPPSPKFISNSFRWDLCNKTALRRPSNLKDHSHS